VVGRNGPRVDAVPACGRAVPKAGRQRVWALAFTTMQLRQPAATSSRPSRCSQPARWLPTWVDGRPRCVSTTIVSSPSGVSATSTVDAPGASGLQPERCPSWTLRGTAARRRCRHRGRRPRPVDEEHAAGRRSSSARLPDPLNDERGVGEVWDNDLGRCLDVLGRPDDVVADLCSHGYLFGGRGWAVSTAFFRRLRALGQNSESSSHTGSSDSWRSGRRVPSRHSVRMLACVSTPMCWLTAC
jgi:hypothetical protein